MEGTGDPWRPCFGGVEIRVRVTPRAGRDAVEGIEARGGRCVVKLRVRVPAENGAANKASRRLIAEALGRPASAVTLASRASARHKVFRVEGTTPEAAAFALGRGARPA
jgi:uncharacterized protein YggU (UPF0235/DUF167 family)